MTEQECKDFAKCVYLEVLEGKSIRFKGGGQYMTALIRGGFFN